MDAGVEYQENADTRIDGGLQSTIQGLWLELAGAISKAGSIHDRLIGADDSAKPSVEPSPPYGTRELLDEAVKRMAELRQRLSQIHETLFG